MTDSMRCHGMRDLLPDEMKSFRRVEGAFRAVSEGWGYREIRTPTIEHLYLFTAAGTLSPQMLDRVYSFLDWDGWSGERVVLRPDSTIPAARLYTEQLVDGELAKLFYVQNVFRFEQGDASREDWQCGVELIGDSQPHGDVELILMACEVLQQLGLTAQVKLSAPGLLRAILETAGFDLTEQLVLFDRVLDGDMTALEEVQKRLPALNASLSELLAVDGEGPAYLGNLRGAFAGVIPAMEKPLDELAAVSSALQEVGVTHAISPVLVRNFEYYTGPVFQLEVNGKKVGGGGRYDALISLVGGGPTPGAGFALETEALISLLPQAKVADAQPITIRCGANGARIGAAFQLARALRDIGRPIAIITTGEAADVVVTGDAFEVRSRGGKGERLTGIDEVLRAVAGRLSD